MEYEKTICYNLKQVSETLETLLQKKEFDPNTFFANLRLARIRADKMEKGLKLRRRMMIEAGLEEKYQKDKGKDWRLDDNREDNQRTDRVPGEPSFHIVIKNNKTGKVEFEGDYIAAILSAVEQMDEMDEQGIIDGNSYRFMFGTPVACWYAFDQLSTAIQGTMFQVKEEIAKQFRAKGWKLPF